MQKSALVLEDNSFYEGHSFGAEKSISGEVVFNTGMVGYPESLTDPSYRGQILVLTYPLIGNYGVPANNEENFESGKIQISGLIVSNYSKQHSHWNSVKSLSEWLKEHSIPALTGIDTRALTKKLRENGTVPGKMVFNEDINFNDPNKRNLVEEVSVKKPVLYEKGKIIKTDERFLGHKEAQLPVHQKSQRDFSVCQRRKPSLCTKIIVIDCGCKNSIIRSLLKRDIAVLKVPWGYNFFKEDFDAVLISNGPGDPKHCKETIANVRKAVEQDIPVFGICLGNQILALAAGADTYKLKYGHRSQNQPCILDGTKRCFITSQNHGFAVDTKILPDDWQPWFTNANDGTNEGIIHRTKPFMSIQFHPEAYPGPLDTGFLFDKFLEKIK